MLGHSNLDFFPVWLKANLGGRALALPGFPLMPKALRNGKAKVKVA